jgi:CMP-N-acetylneuraminic acid synthetase
VGEGLWMGTFQKKNDPVLFPMREEECFDIDYEHQFEMASILYKQGWKPNA